MVIRDRISCTRNEEAPAVRRLNKRAHVGGDGSASARGVPIVCAFFGYHRLRVIPVRKSPILANGWKGLNPKVFGFAAVLLLTSMHAASAFSASFSWLGIKACGRTSPAFTIQDAPEGTERLRFVMIDKDAPNFRHGGSTVPYNGSGRVPEGAIDYITRVTGLICVNHL